MDTWDDDDIPGLSVDFDFTVTRTIRGARDSLGGQAGMGPPLEPDEVEGYYEVKEVRLYDVVLDINELDLGGPFGEEDEMAVDVSEKVAQRLQECLGVPVKNNG